MLINHFPKMRQARTYREGTMVQEGFPIQENSASKSAKNIMVNTTENNLNLRAGSMHSLPYHYCELNH